MTLRERYADVTLARALEARIRQGHPWIYRDALHAPPALADGTPVRLCGRDGTPLALGFWDAQSPIAVRLLTSDPGAALPPLVLARLASALGRRRERIDWQLTNAFRWVHGEADGLPGVHVDLYDRVASVRYDGEGARAFYRTLPDLLRAVGGQPGPAGVQLVQQVIDRQDRADDSAGEIEVRENGLLFGVDLQRGQKGGLFLDQRDNRAEVGRHARDRRVLNLFGYTGGFSIYAAAGGARATDTVDLARPALEAARRNLERNGLAGGAHRVHAEDAFVFLERAAAAGQTWDIVISDPPSFAPRASAVPAALAAYRRLHALGAAVVADGGLFCPASCSSHVTRRDFLASVEDGAAAAHRRFLLQTLRGAGEDHPVVPWFPEGDYLKFAMGTLQARR
jgi:23S rRNA (cytosine1962-C5)-methyltransferase